MLFGFFWGGRGDPLGIEGCLRGRQTTFLLMIREFGGCAENGVFQQYTLLFHSRLTHRNTFYIRDLLFSKTMYSNTAYFFFRCI